MLSPTCSKVDAAEFKNGPSAAFFKEIGDSVVCAVEILLSKMLKHQAPGIAATGFALPVPAMSEQSRGPVQTLRVRPLCFLLQLYQSSGKPRLEVADYISEEVWAEKHAVCGGIAYRSGRGHLR